MSVLDPVSVILVTAGSRGEALLFRYPFCTGSDVEVDGKYKYIIMLFIIVFQYFVQAF